MKLLVALVALVAALAEGFHLKTVFTIPLPLAPSQTEFFTAGAGNTYYTVGTGGELMAVDLVTKKVMWKREFAGDAISGLTGFTSPGGGKDVLLISLGTAATVALDNTSSLLWVNTALDISLSAATPNSWTVSNDTLYFVNTNDEDGETAFSALNLLTGLITSSMTCVSAIIYPNEAILTNNTGGTVNEVTAYQLPSMKQLWSLAVDAFLAQNKDYLVVALHQSQDGSEYTEALVLNPQTLAPISTIRSVTGIVSDGFVEILNHHFLLAKIGADSAYAYFDLRTGNMIWELGGSGSGSGSASTGGTVPAAAGIYGILATNNSIIVLDGLALHFISIQTGHRLASQGYVPTLPAGTLSQSIDGSVASVFNFQGYTQWNTATGQYVGRNEMEPGAGPAAALSAYLWMGKYYVSTVGRTVIGQEVVQ